MSVEKRGDKWIARVYIGKDANGKKIYDNKTFDLKKDAIEHENSVSNLKKNIPNYAVNGKVLFASVADKYFKHIELTKEINTIDNYKSRYNKWIKDQLGLYQISLINHQVLLNYFNQIRMEGARPKTVRYVKIVLNEIFQFATRQIEQYISVNPVNFIELPEQENEEYDAIESVKFWDLPSIKKFIQYNDDKIYQRFCLILLNTGMRINELVSLRLEDIELENNIIRLSVQIQKRKMNEHSSNQDCKLELKKLKGKAARIVPLNKKAKELIKEQLEYSQFEYFLFPNKLSRSKKILVNGKKKQLIIEASFLTKRCLNTYVTKASQDLEIEDIGPHGLRHTFASHFVMNGGDIYQLSKIIGHSEKSTSELYAHFSESFIKKSVNIIDFNK